MPLAIAFRIERFALLPSTQEAVRRRLERGEDVDGLVVRAARQSRGRGRRGTPWESSAGGSYQTLAVRDPSPPSLGRGGAAIAVAVGMAETFRESGLQLGVKWPNDLVYRRRKLGGILTEYRRGHLLVGVGVNVDNAPPEGAAALRGWNVEGVHATVLEGIRCGLDRWLDAPDRLPERFEAFDVLAGRQVTVVQAGEQRRGVARGIDPDGGLLLAPAEASEAAERLTTLRSGRVLSGWADARPRPER